MTTLELAALRQLVLKVLTHHAGSESDAAAVAVAARRAYDDLARVLIPLIGQVGIDALSTRAVHLLRREFARLATTREPEQTEAPFAQVISSLEWQDTALAAEAAATLLAILIGLLFTLIGEPLTTRLVRKAWPDGFSDAGVEETRA
jgi:hypothetical protein